MIILWCLLNSLNSEFSGNLYNHGFPWWLSGKESTCQCRRCRFDPWVGKIPWRRKWLNPLQYSCLGNFMNRGPWRATVHRVTKELDMTEQLNNDNSIIIGNHKQATWSLNKQVFLSFLTRISDYLLRNFSKDECTLKILSPIQMYGFFSSHTKQFSDTKMGVLQFNSILKLLRKNIRSHKLRAQSLKTASYYHHFRCQLQVQVVTSASDHLSVDWREGPMAFSLGLVSLLDGLREVTATFTYWTTSLF